jgi:hypothetical protein
MTGQQGFRFLEERARCTHPRRRLRWRLLDLGRAHLGSYCAGRGKWLKWISQGRAALTEAPPRPTGAR